MSANPQSTCAKTQVISNWSMMDNVYRNDIAQILELCPTTLLVLISLCSHYNVKRNDCFPNQSLIAKKWGIAERTVRQAIQILKEKGLITITRRKRKNIYHFTQKLLDLLCTQNLQKNSVKKIQADSAANTSKTITVIQADSAASCINIRNEHNINKETSLTYDRSKQTAKILNDDVSLKTNSKDDLQLKETLIKLKNWGVWDSAQLIKKYTLTGVDIAIKYVENSDAQNKGGYLRTILKSGYDCTPNVKKDDSGAKLKQLEASLKEEQYMQPLLKSEFWKHIPTGKIFRSIHANTKKPLFIYDRSKSTVHVIGQDLPNEPIQNIEPVTEKEYRTFTGLSSDDIFECPREEALKFCRAIHPESRRFFSSFQKLVVMHGFTDEELC